MGDPNWVHNLRGLLTGVPFAEEMKAEILRCFNEFYHNHAWHPIGTAPKDGTIVDLLTTGGSIAYDEWWIDEEGEAFWSCDYDDKFVTHWRPASSLLGPPQ